MVRDGRNAATSSEPYVLPVEIAAPAVALERSYQDQVAWSACR